MRTPGGPPHKRRRGKHRRGREHGKRDYPQQTDSPWRNNDSAYGDFTFDVTADQRFISKSTHDLIAEFLAETGLDA